MEPPHPPRTFVCSGPKYQPGVYWGTQLKNLKSQRIPSPGDRCRRTSATTSGDTSRGRKPVLMPRCTWGGGFLLDSNRRAGRRQPRRSWQEVPLKANRENLLDFQPWWSNTDEISAADSLSCFNSSNYREAKNGIKPTRNVSRHAIFNNEILSCVHI